MTTNYSNYNERSWAIDLIGHIKQFIGDKDLIIKEIGGEQTIKVETTSMYPDVLLFGDRSSSRILQGWELKMPDTNIYDIDFINNARTKALSLELDSFLLWNASCAHLYILNRKTKEYTIKERWDNENKIKNRSDVKNQKEVWRKTSEEIILYINDLFDTENLEGRQFVDAYKSGGVTSLILDNVKDVSAEINTMYLRSKDFRNELDTWWNSIETEYIQEEKKEVLAGIVISNWIGKFLFSQIIREIDSKAKLIRDIQNETTPEEAINILRQISEKCNFWTIFSSNHIGLLLITEKTWRELKQFNYLLSDLRLGSVAQEQLSLILEATVDVNTRKLRGQYTTPSTLADLLVRLSVNDIIEDKIYDPCCGSGTIIRAAQEYKIQHRVDREMISKTIYASDIDLYAVQVSTFSLVKKELTSRILRIFRHNVFNLKHDQSIDFRNPDSGELLHEQLGHFDVIISNLPFISQKGRKQYSELISNSNIELSRRADIYAFIPFLLFPLLKESGRLGIIVTNSWLATNWGEEFFINISRLFHIKKIIISGCGRWFQNSEVVTNIIILERKYSAEEKNSDTSFIVLKVPLEEINDTKSLDRIVRQIESGQTFEETTSVRVVSQDQLNRFRLFGLSGTAQFVDCEWVLNLPLTRISNFLDVSRGERRGCNNLFYPKGNHGIERDYIRPLVKNSKNFTSLVLANPQGQAFSCSLSIEELTALEHNGAIHWINQFNTPKNREKLAKRDTLWYEMNSSALTELVMFINYGDRLFVGRISPPCFVDQRMIRLMPRRELNICLFHALLNCTISLFFLEGMGFGRGQGALDLNKDRIENKFHILNPETLTLQSQQRIIDAFIPLTKRNILSIPDELEQNDRQHFDDLIISEFNIQTPRSLIYDCLLKLMAIRNTSDL